MPYAPGVEDISGQLRAQGKLAQSQGITGGVTGGFLEFQQNKLRNQVLQGENEGLLKAFMSDPQTAKYAPDGIDKFIEKTTKGGGLSLKDNLQLNGMLNTALKTRSVIDQQQEAAQMRQVREQEMKSRAMQIQSAQQEQAAVDRLRQLAQFGQGVGTGVLRPEVQAQKQAQLQDPLTQFSMQVVQNTGRAPAPADLREMAQQQAGGTATTAMRDTNAIIDAEIKSGKLSADKVAARRAELMAAGGRDPGSRFDSAGTFVDAETGGNARPAVKDRSTGQIGYVGVDGKFEPLDPSKWKPSTVSDTNALLDPPAFDKLRQKVNEDERSIRQLGRYLNGFDNLQQGAAQIADKVAKNIKTIFTKEPLTDQEKATGLQQGRLQQIIGGLRTAVVGPGVMTEQDAQRIVDALGGDVDALQNQNIVASLIGEILQEKMKEYDSDLSVYNTHVAHKYGGQAGYKQRERVNVEFKKPSPVTPAAIPAITGKTTDELEKRLQQLRGGK